MLDNEKYTTEELEFYIKKFINYKDVDTLVFLCVILKKIKVLILIEKDIKNIQTTKTKDGRVWFVCYSSNKKINNEINNKYKLLKIDFYKFIKDVISDEKIEGIVINPTSDFPLYLNKKILNKLDNIQ